MVETFKGICDDFRKNPEDFVLRFRPRLRVAARQTEDSRDWCRRRMIDLWLTSGDIENVVQVVGKEICSRGGNDGDFPGILQDEKSPEEHLSNNEDKRTRGPKVSLSGKGPKSDAIFQTRLSSSSPSTCSEVQSSILPQLTNSSTAQLHDLGLNQDKASQKEPKVIRKYGRNSQPKDKTTRDSAKGSKDRAKADQEQKGKISPNKVKATREVSKNSTKAALEDGVGSPNKANAVPENNDNTPLEKPKASLEGSEAAPNDGKAVLKDGMGSQSKDTAVRGDARDEEYWHIQLQRVILQLSGYILQSAQSILQFFRMMTVQFAGFVYSIWHDDIILGMSIEWCIKIIFKTLCSAAVIISMVYLVIYVIEQIPIVGPLAGFAIRRFIKYCSSIAEAQTERDSAVTDDHTSMVFNYFSLVVSWFTLSPLLNSTGVSSAVIFDTPSLNESFSAVSNVTERLGNASIAFLPIGSILGNSAFAMGSSVAIVKASDIKLKEELLASYEGLLYSSKTLSDLCHTWSVLMTGLINHVEIYHNVCLVKLGSIEAGAQRYDTSPPLAPLILAVSVAASLGCGALPYFLGVGILSNSVGQLACSVAFTVFVQMPCLSDQSGTPPLTSPWCFPARVSGFGSPFADKQSADAAHADEVLEIITEYFHTLDSGFYNLREAAHQGLELADKIAQYHTDVEALRRQPENIALMDISKLKVKAEDLLPRQWWQLWAQKRGLELADKYDLVSLESQLRNLSELRPAQEKAAQFFFEAISRLKDLEIESVNILNYLRNGKIQIIDGVPVDWKDIIHQMKTFKPMIHRLNVLNNGYMDQKWKNSEFFRLRGTECMKNQKVEPWEDCFFRDL